MREWDIGWGGGGGIGTCVGACWSEKKAVEICFLWSQWTNDTEKEKNCEFEARPIYLLFKACRQRSMLKPRTRLNIKLTYPQNKGPLLLSYFTPIFSERLLHLCSLSVFSFFFFFLLCSAVKHLRKLYASPFNSECNWRFSADYKK